MSFFNWDTKYELGIKEIDEQHKKWIDIMNQFYDAFMAKSHGDIIEDILDKLDDYTIYHFGVEEKYFSKYHYKETEAHIAKHKEFINKIKEFKEEYKKNPESLTYKMMNFLRLWFQEHILGTDKKYVSFFQENNLLK